MGAHLLDKEAKLKVKWVLDMVQIPIKLQVDVPIIRSQFCSRVIKVALLLMLQKPT